MSNLEILRTWAVNIAQKCSDWIVPGVGGKLEFHDPIDGREVSAHYGATHAAAALIVWGIHQNDDILFEKGVALMESVLERWHESVKLLDFHHDFNNFALCVAEGYLKERYAFLGAKIRAVVLATPDSNHYTVNWLPMRAYVNAKRYEWSGNSRYEIARKNCLSYIAQSTNPDGGIEDRLPKGTSFNLQYDVATVCILQFMRVCGLSLDLSKELGFLLNAVAPDGDINYQGRGTNQIFAWSCWLYVLASTGREEELSKSLFFLEGKLSSMLDNNNLILNEHEGEEKHLWWDYHYASVYIAHLLFWVVMAIRDYGKAPISPLFVVDGSTGLHVLRDDDYFVVTFDGRSEYLAEKGPAIVALWTRKEKMIFKGEFGPWQGQFGNQHSPAETVLGNFWGVVVAKANYDLHHYRIIRRLLPNLRLSPSLKVRPLFKDVTIRIEDSNYVEVEYAVPKGAVLNLPVFDGSSYVPEVYGENRKRIPVTCHYILCNQYTTARVYRTIPENYNILTVRVPK